MGSIVLGSAVVGSKVVGSIVRISVIDSIVEETIVGVTEVDWVKLAVTFTTVSLKISALLTKFSNSPISSVVTTSKVALT